MRDVPDGSGAPVGRIHDRELLEPTVGDLWEAKRALAAGGVPEWRVVLLVEFGELDTLPALAIRASECY